MFFFLSWFHTLLQHYLFHHYPAVLSVRTRVSDSADQTFIGRHSATFVVQSPRTIWLWSSENRAGSFTASHWESCVSCSAKSTQNFQLWGDIRLEFMSWLEFMFENSFIWLSDFQFSVQSIGYSTLLLIPSNCKQSNQTTHNDQVSLMMHGMAVQ